VRWSHGQARLARRVAAILRPHSPEAPKVCNDLMSAWVSQLGSSQWWDGLDRSPRTAVVQAWSKGVTNVAWLVRGSELPYR